VQQKIPLPEMTELRITPQMATYPKIANDVFLLLLDGKLRSRTETLKFLKAAGAATSANRLLLRQPNGDEEPRLLLLLLRPWRPAASRALRGREEWRRLRSDLSSRSRLTKGRRSPAAKLAAPAKTRCCCESSGACEACRSSQSEQTSQGSCSEESE